MNIAIVLSGGTGNRINSDIPKQYIRVNGRRIISYSLEVIMKNSNIDGIVVVADKKWHESITEDIKALHIVDCEYLGCAVPGENRQLSILSGLDYIRFLTGADDNNQVLIHDAARPCLTSELIDRIFDRMKEHDIDGVMPVIPVKDTLYNIDANINLLDRSKIYAGQAPELFVFGKYYVANRALLPDRIYDIKGSTEPAVIANMNIATVIGDENNYKITTDLDLSRFRYEKEDY